MQGGAGKWLEERGEAAQQSFCGLSRRRSSFGGTSEAVTRLAIGQVVLTQQLQSVCRPALIFHPNGEKLSTDIQVRCFVPCLSRWCRHGEAEVIARAVGPCSLGVCLGHEQLVDSALGTHLDLKLDYDLSAWGDTTVVIYPPYILRNHAGLHLVYGHPTSETVAPLVGSQGAVAAAGQDVQVSSEPSMLASLLGLALGLSQVLSPLPALHLSR